ncbi:TetR/AcrR family transcriptional regulator [Albimonas pacifica]|uniref:Transcriptional regulator, TetR family n=1 Tax=Albimonas pacifica TaxID=1114924 RepID=A0A1I3BLT0_9RHOB|nr:TetR family transcriptional regulator [Albimonas pacifica]SFH63255.1 transcriptional regulator, TetR family [Albimonas pacifica]
MRVSRDQVAKNRAAILRAAGRLFRERGCDAVSVAEVMKAAGLTHGGFYGHFRNKDDLVAQALAAAFEELGPGPADPAESAALYLSDSHRADVAGGCPIAALASEAARLPGPARAEMTRAMRGRIERMAQTAPGADEQARRQAAAAQWASMVGALVLARLSDDPALSDEILEAARARFGPAGPAPQGVPAKAR